MFSIFVRMVGTRHLLPDCLINRATSAGSRWKTIRPLILVFGVESQIVNKERMFHLVTRSFDRNPELPAGVSSRTLATLNQRP